MFAQLAARTESTQILATSAAQFPTRMYMGRVQRLLERLGYVRLRDFGLILTADRRVVTTRSKVLDDGYRGCVVGWNDDDLATLELATWSADPPALPPPAPPPKRLLARSSSPPPQAVAVAPIVKTPPTPIAQDTSAGEDEWEWEIAAARARASCEHIPAPAPPAKSCSSDNEITAINPQIQPDVSRPRTVLPVPALPAIDPRLVRSYEAPQRFPRATDRHVVATNRAPLPLRSARR